MIPSTGKLWENRPEWFNYQAVIEPLRESLMTILFPKGKGIASSWQCALSQESEGAYHGEPVSEIGVSQLVIMKGSGSKTDRTKEAIAESFRNLLSQKPASKIRVSEIVDGCGMTAPTFYNHFKDKHALTVWMYVNDGTRIMDNIGNGDYRWKDTLLDGMRYFLENRDFVLGSLVHVNGESEFISAMEETNTRLLLKEVEKKIPAGTGMPEHIRELVKIYCLGTCRYVYLWLISENPVSPEEAASLFEDCLPYKLRYYLVDL